MKLHRIFLVNRKGDGKTIATMFAPDVPDSTHYNCYTVGTKFLLATDADLSAYGTELTSEKAVNMAAALYGITVDHLGYTAARASFFAHCKQIIVVALHGAATLIRRLWQA